MNRALYDHGFARVAACTIRTSIADPAANARAVQAVVSVCHAQSVAVAVFPELTLSGYAIDDLLLQDALLDAVRDALAALITASRDWTPVLVVGAPLAWGNRLYNAAVAIHRGRILGVVPKSYLPTYREFYEARHFAAGADIQNQQIQIGPHTAPFGTDLLFQAEDIGGLRFGIEICEDVWTPIPPSSRQALAGATVLLNLSASPVTIGRAAERALLCQAQSARCLAAYVYTAAGAGESTTDLAWDGQSMIAENGVMLAESARFQDEGHCLIADLDLDLLRQARLRMGSFDDAARSVRESALPFRIVSWAVQPPKTDIGFRRPISRFPFVPADPAHLAQDCFEAAAIQTAGLRQRLRGSGIERVVIGISGGLDSAQALLICARTMDEMGLPRSHIHAYTLPGFGTGAESHAAALDLIRHLGVAAAEIDITPAAMLMLRDIGHPFASGQAVHDITFENVQAGLRTDYLFRLANQHKALVVGTGDLSELALGWCTYGVGDQMAHYNVNAGLPKTLIQHVIRWMVENGPFSGETASVLKRILAAEISPELTPVGETPQSTEAQIGPFALQDFNLYYSLRHGFRPGKIAFLALQAWEDADRGIWPPGFPPEQRQAYDADTIRRWLAVFVQRFYGFSQFKRSAMPNGPKITAGGALSPRGDWRAPSDGNARVWRDALSGGNGETPLG